MPEANNKTISARALAVTNTATTKVRCPLADATSVQVYIRPTSTQQVYTITLLDGTTIEVPQGSPYTHRGAYNFSADEHLFDVQTATSAATLQVIGVRETLQ